MIRSLPLEPGCHAVLPLYDEVGASQEMDTVDVARSESRSHGRWTGRFADSFMVTDFRIDAASREITSYEKTSRKARGGSACSAGTPGREIRETSISARGSP